MKFFSRVSAPFMAPLAFLSFSFTHASEFELSGRVGAELRLFIDDQETQAGLLAEPELYWSSDSGDDAFTFKLFARYDDLDDERTHIDIREAFWLHVGSGWELRAGISKVFWGVTESNHLVDIVNQTDAVESADGEQKLGQPMVRYTKLNDWGVLDFFVLPGFRERTFPGAEGRLAGPVAVATDKAEYESDQEQRHVDFAFRYGHYIGIFDFGVTGFSGTNREPQLRFTQSEGNQPELIPYYDQITQVGADAQATTGDWLLKFEGIYREDSLEKFTAFTAGFEYTFVNMFDSGLDLGVLSEYNKDTRQFMAPPLDDDVFVGARLTFNDIQSTEFLIGGSQDLNRSNSRLIFVEGNRRIGESWKLTVDARTFSSTDAADPVFVIREDDYASLTMEYYY